LRDYRVSAGIGIGAVFRLCKMENWNQLTDRFGHKNAIGLRALMTKF
jgi:hypothetical protein